MTTATMIYREHLQGKALNSFNYKVNQIVLIHPVP